MIRNTALQRLLSLCTDLRFGRGCAAASCRVSTGLKLETARFAHVQLRYEFAGPTCNPHSFDPVEQEFCRFKSDLIFGQLDSRQARMKDSEPWVIVEAHHAKVFGATHTHLVGGSHEAYGHKIIRN